MPTLDEVARHAGVSRAVASRVINDAPHVSPAKRAAVEAAVRELGYVPNPTARALATRQVGSVVLAMPDEGPDLFAEPFFARVVRGVSEALAPTDLDLMLLATSGHGRERVQRLVRHRRTDGLMLMAVHGDDPLLELAGTSDVPIVFGGRPLHTEPRWYVDVDNEAGARTAVEHLVATGHRRIGVITGPVDMQVAQARRQGFVDAMRAAGLDPSWVQVGDFSEPSGTAATVRLLAAHPDVEAIFAASDNMAVGAIRALRAAGRSVPGDVSVVGYDDLQTARLSDPMLTTVHQPVAELGRQMAAMVLALLARQTPAPVLLAPHLVERDSVRRR